MWHLTEAAVRVDERAVYEVAPGPDELIVVASQKVGPGEIGVLRLRAPEHQIEAERVGVVAREEVVHVDRDVPARRELASFHREELARHDVVRELQRLAAATGDVSAVAVAEQ